MTLLGPFGAHDALARRPSRSGAAGYLGIRPLRKLALLLALAPAALHAGPRDEGRDVVVNGKRAETCAPAAQAHAGAVDYACLNGQLEAAATAAQPAPPAADAVTAQATTPSKAGTFSFSATHERLGSSFGRSVAPQRPPAPGYSNAVTGARARP